MTAKQNTGIYAPDGSLYITLTDGAGNLASAGGGGGSGDALVANPLSQFAATTSLQLKGVISDETGSGALVFATSPTLVTPALGTPVSGVATNLTGTASGLTAGTVTTNANLTGVITSSGNATSIASQTGTGTKFVVDTSPTLVTPALGVATGTSLAIGGATIGSNALAVTGTANISGATLVGSLRGGGTALTAYSVQGATVVAESQLGLTTSGTNYIYGTTTGVHIIGSGRFTFAPLDAASAEDSNLNRVSAGVLAIGTTAANALGSLNLTNLTATGQLNATAGTITTSAPGLNLTQTWNAAGVVFNAFKIDITDTASSNASTAFSAGWGGSPYLSLVKRGNGTVLPVGDGSGSIGESSTRWSSAWFFNTLNMQSDTGTLRFGSSNDVLLSRGGAAATLQLGGPDVPSGAVAQTLQPQGNTGSTINGMLFTIKGSGGGSSTSVGGELRLQGGLSSAAAGTGGAVTIYTAPASAGATPALVATFAASGAITFNGSLTLSGGSSNLVTSAEVYAVNLNVNANTSKIQLGTSLDVVLTRGGAAATLQHGAADAASPVAQTIKFQDVVAGTSNTAGVDATIKASAGTGTGVGGSLVFQTAPAGSTGTTKNTWATSFTVKNGTAVLASYTVATLPSASVSGAGATAFVTDASTTLILGLGTTVAGSGSNKVPVYSDGTNWIYG